MRLHRDFASLRAVFCHLGRDTQAKIEEAIDKVKEEDTRQKDAKKKLFRARLQDLNGENLKKWAGSIDDLEKQLRLIEEDLSRVQRVGELNTVGYLTLDHLDVYVATSMRESWEYESTFQFIKGIFGLKDRFLERLRYFDPTLSFLKSRIDKGLVEGLMLKRASCTLYMIQETDTLGKDSELASTLAQGKPVIAYVPKISPAEVEAELKSAPLRFLSKRLTLLMAEDKLNGEELDTVVEFIRKVANFKPVFTLVGDEEENFLGTLPELPKIKKILAAAESAYFDKRATDLMQNHPLAIQVHLESGVANGVLVVRSYEACAQLLTKLLTNDCEFNIERDGNCTVLREKISSCPFRVVTDDSTLTNAFWNFYL
jgi:hypothetical protein